MGKSFENSYDIDLEDIRLSEYPMTDTTYLDHAGTTLYSKSLIEAFATEMTSNLLGNPHSASSAAQLSSRRVDDVRLRMLHFFNADPEHFDLVFVANATAGMKLVMDAFREQEQGFWYGYHKDAHTSLHGKNTYSLLDAAALVSTCPLDLGNAALAPDYTVLSFYKIFGFPDLGALIVRKAAAEPLLKRSYFGGGTVDMVTVGQGGWHIKKQGHLHQQLEDGTLPIHNIMALDSALQVHKRLYKSLRCVASHTMALAEEVYQQLSSFRHFNGTHVCEIYKDPASSYADSTTQGPIISFNFRNSSGHFVSNAEVEKLATIRNIQIRTGGLCNPGGIASSLELTSQDFRRNFSAGVRCGQGGLIIGGKPTGVIRVSLGAMSNLEDITTFVDFVREFFVEARPKEPPAADVNGSIGSFYVESLTIYPIKSCGGWRAPSDSEWDIKQEGLAWDREWCLVHQGTRKALSQKTYPKMALLRPSIDLKPNLLRIHYAAFLPGLPDEISVSLTPDSKISNNADLTTSEMEAEVCGQEVPMNTYQSETIARFFSTILGTPCTLARFRQPQSCPSGRHSKAHLAPISTSPVPRPILLSNESPMLVITRSSVNRLNEQIKSADGKAAHASVFRANIVLAEDRPGLDPGFEQPYVEDAWEYLRIGKASRKVTLDVLGGCRRCQMVCIDQTTGEKDGEPFITLAKTRRNKGQVFFGVHTALAKGGDDEANARVKVGDRVVPIKTVRLDDRLV
ncbi:MAG: hypothetical protein OHK93_002226 [Ramalina farinacea]|uniref:Molybdenum cofactor sulfurase n=1 Tax=Ramalina farinacea TaxID=258253 RepID=A0AA43QTN8_9LECA|nr:hypothetical protein [Ramalina farinacea]